MMYDFTGPIIKSKDAHLYRRIGSDFTLDTASRIGFRRAWYTSPYCMKNIYGENFDMSVAVIYYDWEELGLMLQNGEVSIVMKDIYSCTLCAGRPGILHDRTPDCHLTACT